VSHWFLDIRPHERRRCSSASCDRSPGPWPWPPLISAQSARRLRTRIGATPVRSGQTAARRASRATSKTTLPRRALYLAFLRPAGGFEYPIAYPTRARPRDPEQRLVSASTRGFSPLHLLSAAALQARRSSSARPRDYISSCRERDGGTADSSTVQNYRPTLVARSHELRARVGDRPSSRRQPGTASWPCSRLAPGTRPPALLERWTESQLSRARRPTAPPIRRGCSTTTTGVLRDAQPRSSRCRSMAARTRSDDKTSDYSPSAAPRSGHSRSIRWTPSGGRAGARLEEGGWRRKGGRRARPGRGARTPPRRGPGRPDWLRRQIARRRTVDAAAG
jgi:hypothetical protein